MGRDNLTDSPIENLRAATYSIFDQDLAELGRQIFVTNTFGETELVGDKIFSVNRFNFDTMQKLLIPRAVGYSAGLINYFFRGDIEMYEDSDRPGTYVVFNKGNELLTGTFGLYYDDVSDNRVLLNTWTLSIPAGGKVNVGAIAPPAEPAPKKRDEYMLVFNGDMGDETRADYGVGGVTAAVVTLSSGGNALYLAGADANNRLVLMRVDRNGTAIVGSGDFHPLRDMFAFNVNARQKTYLAKQSEFAADGESYRIRSVTLGQQALPMSSYGYIFHRDVANPTSLDYFESSNKLSWSTRYDSANGPRLIVFRLSIQSDNAATLTYDLYDASSGTPQALATVPVSVPAPPAQAGQGFSYYDIALGRILVSPDGTRLVGFSDGGGNRARVNLELVLTIGDIVSARWVQSATDSFENSQTFTPQTVAQVGTLSTTVPDATCPPNQESLTISNIPLTRTTSSSGSTFASTTTRFFDFQKGKLLGLRSSRDFRAVSQVDITSGNITSSACQDNWLRTVLSGSSTNFSEEMNSSGVISGGVVTAGASTFERTLYGSADDPGPSRSNYSVMYEYEGYLAGATPISYVPIGGISVPPTGTRIIQAFTDNIADAITTVVDPAFPGQSTYRLNGQVISTTGSVPNYVADASPLGELFFAATDLSVVIHKPKANSIKIWQKPASVVRLLGAIWM
jgi:hypothetical protein